MVHPLQERRSIVSGGIAVLLLMTCVGFAIADEVGLARHWLDGATA